MVEVYTNNVLEFKGTFKETSKYIGVSIESLYFINQGRIIHIPYHAKCDYVIINDNKYYKKPRSKKIRKQKVKMELGMELVIDEVKYTLTNISKTKRGIKYTFNYSLDINAKNEYTLYNSLYTAILRAVKKNEKH